MAGSGGDLRGGNRDGARDGARNVCECAAGFVGGFYQGKLMACAIVARSGQGGEVLGWATLAAVSDRCVYAGVAEVRV